MKRNKVILSIIICILIILVGMLVYLKLNYYKTEKAMFELTQNINNCNNLHVHTIETSNKYGKVETDKYWKDNEFIEKSIYGTAYINSVEKSLISISEEDKNVYITENDDINIRQINDKAEDFTGIFIVDADNLNQDYQYCGVENINNKECYKIFVKNKLQEEEETLWIEKDTGFVLKQEHLFNEELVTYERTYEIGIVTDEDVRKPDVQDYKETGEYEFIYKKYKENGECEVTHIEPQGDTYSYIE